MGFFSWMTADTNESISNAYSDRGTFTVYLLASDGRKFREDNYDGYGIFGGKDAYQLLAEMNSPDECNDDEDSDRGVGIELAFGTGPVFFPIKIVRDPDLCYDAVPASARCPEQGYFYCDDDPDDYNELDGEYPDEYVTYPEEEENDDE